MPRRYEIIESNFTLQATMDLAQIKNAAGSNKLVRIIRWWWSAVDNTLASAQMIRVLGQVLPVTVTDGSGGATPTPRPLDPGDAAATFTALTRNTVQATTNGTARTYDDQSRHIYNGYEQQPEEPIELPPGSSFVMSMPMSAITGSPKISIGVEVEEIG